MANNTENYNLTKPTENEFYDIAVQNENMDIIDRILKSKVDAISGKQLSTNDFTDSLKQKLEDFPTMQELSNEMRNFSANVSAEFTKQATAKRLTLSPSAWSDTAPFTQTILVSGVRDTDIPIGSILVSKGADNAMKKAAECVDGFETGNGSITFYCNRKKPSVELTAIIKGV